VLNAACAYAIRSMGVRGKEASTYMVSGTAFFKYYDIDTSVARRYLATLNEGVMCLDLSQPGTIVTSNRDGSGKNAAGGAEIDVSPVAETAG